LDRLTRSLQNLSELVSRVRVKWNTGFRKELSALDRLWGFRLNARSIERGGNKQALLLTYRKIQDDLRDDLNDFGGAKGATIGMLREDRKPGNLLRVDQR